MIRKAILKDVNSIEDTYNEHFQYELNHTCLLYTSDAADE